MSAESLLPWFYRKEFRGWSYGSFDIRDVVMVAGQDPYAYKGFEEVNAAFVRPVKI
jgi:hypothetical protein